MNVDVLNKYFDCFLIPKKVWANKSELLSKAGKIKYDLDLVQQSATY